MSPSKFLLTCATALTLTACGGGGSDGNTTTTPITSDTPATTAPSANVAPVANAGTPQNVLAGSTVTLDGSTSADANSDALTYTWLLTEKPAGSNVSLAAPTSPKPTFIADVAGTYAFTLFVNDGKLNSQNVTATVIATVGNAAPTAQAGPVQNVVTGASVTLDGSASMDANGDMLTYAWVMTGKPNGSTSSLAAPASPKPVFTADVAGTYLFALVVSNGKTSSQAATTVVNATVGNAMPIANAGPAQSVMTGTTVTLDGSASTDANGDTITYSWVLTGRPVGSNSNLAAPFSPKPTFFPDVPGIYVVSLMVNDGKANSQIATVTVNATAANAAPVANAGFSQEIIAGKSVILDGSTSFDPNGDALGYAWSFVTRPAGSVATLTDASQAKAAFLADVPGVYVLGLVVNDGKVSSQRSVVTVTAAVNNTAPVASAGAAQSAYIGDNVRLDGSASKDDDGDTLSYLWTTKSYPGVFSPTLLGATTAQANFRPTDAGTYVFTLVVNDARAMSAPSTVTVNVANGVAPTPAGTGLVIQNVSNFWTLEEQTLAKRVDFTCNVGLSAIDRRPDGVIVGVSSSQLYEINPAGACSARGNTPEWIISMAVSPQGQIFGKAFSQYALPSGDYGHRLYKLSSSGASQSYVTISGASGYVTAIDFAPDGQLYGLAIGYGGKWIVVKIDPETGVSTRAFDLPLDTSLGDIDIDANGVMRTVINGALYKFDVKSGALLSTQAIPEFPAGSSFAPIVYVP